MLHVAPLVFTVFVLAILILALVVSALPGESAARTRAAGILRSE